MDDTVKLVWATPGADDLVAYMARVSAPANQGNTETAPRLISYLMRQGHWSPFEMASMCVEINTTRDIGRQILRHRSFSFQEFSQRYQDVSALPPATTREARMQDTKNRQNSLEVENPSLQKWWRLAQEQVQTISSSVYDEALARGIAKEVARVVLPEGLTPSRMYMAGTMRSWLHYFNLRNLEHGTQKEHALIAEKCRLLAGQVCPAIMEANALTRAS